MIHRRNKQRQELHRWFHCGGSSGFNNRIRLLLPIADRHPLSTNDEEITKLTSGVEVSRLETLSVICSIAYQRADVSQTTSLTFPLQQTQNVAFTDGSLDVAYDTAAGTFGIHKFHSYLGHITRVTRTSQHSVHLGQLYGLILEYDRMLVRW